MHTHQVGIAMNGVTGRMGRNQHLIRSILSIIQDGGVRLGDREVILPEPVLVGRSPTRLEALAEETGVKKWTTELDAVLGDASVSVYFDAQSTDQRVASVKRAIAAGKHVYCEKPTALSTEDALDLYRLAARSGVRNGVVQDKLWLPGILKLQKLVEMGFFGRILSVRGEFGYWVFDGEYVLPQRPSWNYRKEDGGGIILDMFAHWRYLLDNLFGSVRSVSCVADIALKQRWDENGRKFQCSAEDSAYASFLLEGGAIAHFNSSWAVRVRREDLLTVQVDGTAGSAVAGLRECYVQTAASTPRPVWNPDLENPSRYFDDWSRIPAWANYENAFKAQWQLFLRHVVKNEPFPWTLLEGARGVQLGELAHMSWKERRWVDVPPLEG